MKRLRSWFNKSNEVQEQNAKSDTTTNFKELEKKIAAVVVGASEFSQQSLVLLEEAKAKSEKPVFSFGRSWFNKRKETQEPNAQANIVTPGVLNTKTQTATIAKVQARGTKFEATAQSVYKLQGASKEFANLAREASKQREHYAEKGSNNKPFFTALGALVFGGLGAAVAYIHKYNWNVLYGAILGAVIGALFGFGLGCYTEKSKLPSESIAGAGDPKLLGGEENPSASGRDYTSSLSQ